MFHVSRLNVVNDSDGRRVDTVFTEHGPIPVSPDCKVIVALGTIESTRLALLSFGQDGRIGSNLIAHLRSNIDFRVPRAALPTLSPAIKALQSSALFVKGQHKFKRPDGTEDGTVGHFHFQITASGLGNVDANSEAELFQKIPDIDTVNQHLHGAVGARYRRRALNTPQRRSPIPSSAFSRCCIGRSRSLTSSFTPSRVISCVPLSIAMRAA